jgi:predicted enzyme related to lactoylglutathione lyase
MWSDGGMEVVTVLDCRDPVTLASFWAAALGYQAQRPGGPYLTLTPPDGDAPVLLLQRVPEPKVGKNRMHLDLRVADLTGELARLEGLGARRLSPEPIVEAGWTWYVMADPEGNEFCVLRPPAG